MKFLHLAIFLSVVSCKEGVEITKKEPPPPPAPAPELNLMDPNTAKVGVSPVVVEAKDFGPAFKVPTFDITYTVNNFVRILRCDQSYRGFLEERIIEVEGTENFDDRKWVWADAFGNPKFCKVAAIQTMATTFQDIAAPNGDFFYVINPCVSKELSVTNKEDCSHFLTLSGVISYRDALSDTFLRKAAELSDAEGEYDAIVARLNGLVKNLSAYKEACQLRFEFDADTFERQENVKKYEQAMGDIITVASAGGAGVLTYMAARPLKGLRGKGIMSRTGQLVGRHPFLVAGTVFSSALLISTFIRRSMVVPGTPPQPNCDKAEGLASELLKIQKSGELDKAKEKLITLSNDLLKLNKDFQGYDEQIFTF